MYNKTRKWSPKCTFETFWILRHSRALTASSVTVLALVCSEYLDCAKDTLRPNGRSTFCLFIEKLCLSTQASRCNSLLQRLQENHQKLFGRNSIKKQQREKTELIKNKPRWFRRYSSGFHRLCVYLVICRKTFVCNISCVCCVWVPIVPKNLSMWA